MYAACCVSAPELQHTTTSSFDRGQNINSSPVRLQREVKVSNSMDRGFPENGKMYSLSPAGFCRQGTSVNQCICLDAVGPRGQRANFLTSSPSSLWYTCKFVRVQHSRLPTPDPLCTEHVLYELAHFARKCKERFVIGMDIQTVVIFPCKWDIIRSLVASYGRAKFENEKTNGCRCFGCFSWGFLSEFTMCHVLWCVWCCCVLARRVQRRQPPTL